MYVQRRDPEISEQIAYALATGKSKKQIANDFNLKLSYVVSVSQRAPVKFRIKEIKQKMIAQQSLEQKEVKKEELKEEVVVVKEDQEVKAVKTKKLTDDQKLEIASRYEAGDLARDIAKDFGIHYATVYTIIKKLNVNPHKIYAKRKGEEETTKQLVEEKEQPVKEETKLAEEEPKVTKKKIYIVSGDANKNLPVSKKEETTTQQQKKDDPYDRTKITADEDLFKCGLCSDRHDMPVDTFVFNRIISSLDLTLKSDRVEEAMDFLEKNIPFEDGLPTKKLHLYATGNQILFQAVLIAAMRLKINVIVCHYHNPGGLMVYDDFDMEFNFPDKTNMSGSLKVSSYFTNGFTDKYISNKTTVEELNSADKLYIIKEIYFDKDSKEQKEIYKKVTFFSTLDETFRVFGKMSERITNKANFGDKVALYVHEVKRKNSNEYFVNTAMAKSFSFSK